MWRRGATTGSARRTGGFKRLAHSATQQMNAIAMAASIVLLLSGPAILVREIAGEDEAQSASPVFLSCSARRREITIVANDSWQTICVNGSDKDFYGQCKVKLNLSAAFATSAIHSAQPNRQPAVLVRLYQLQLFPPNTTCSSNRFTLELRALEAVVAGTDMCSDTVHTQYVWVSKSFQLHMYVWPILSGSRASFWVGLAAKRPVNFCQKNSGSSGRQSVDGELYVFAPDTRFSEFLPHFHPRCSNGSKLELAAEKAHSSLHVTIMAAPQKDSCWSLWLNGGLLSDSEPRSFAVGRTVSLIYVLTTEAPICNSDKQQRGFTIRLTAVPALMVASTLTAEVHSSSANLSVESKIVGLSTVVVQAGSAVAATAVAVAAIIVVALLMVHRNRRRRLRRSALGSGQPATCSGVFGRTDSLSYGYPSQVQPKQPCEVPLSEEQLHLVAGVNESSNSVLATAGGDHFNVTMVDNDLYGSAFGSCTHSLKVFVS